MAYVSRCQLPSSARGRVETVCQATEEPGALGVGDSGELGARKQVYKMSGASGEGEGATGVLSEAEGRIDCTR